MLLKYHLIFYARMVSSYLHDVKRELLLLEWQITNDAIWKKEELAEIIVIQTAGIPLLDGASLLGTLSRVSAILPLRGSYSKREGNQKQVSMNFPSRAPCFKRL